LPKPARGLEHRCGNAVCGPFRPANRAADSKAARFFRRLSTVAALRFAALSGPPTAPLPRKRLASSAAGGASPLFHRCGIAVCGPFGSANRAAASKAARFFRRWRRFAAFPPLRQCGLRPFQVRQPRRCLESGSLLPPQAALRRFPTAF